LTALASFNGANGANPGAAVAFDAKGNLYGTAVNGGANSQGVVWELANGTSTITALASFNGANGAYPGACVTFDANGNLYGTADSGANGYGTVWELAKGSNTIAPLAAFNLTNGAAPAAGVTFDANGNLYGTTLSGGAANGGTVWELAKGSNMITALASFNGTNGAQPIGGVTFDANGNLYGTAQSGGTYGIGTVWELAKGSNTINALASFNYSNGNAPQGGVTFDAGGNLYGTAVEGGASGNNGTVWELAKGTNAITALASFNGTNGTYPRGGVTFDANGNLFGTAYTGGAYFSGPNTGGTVWELAEGSNTITALASFDLTNGALPFGDVTFDANGNLYGTALRGGADGQGTVWEFSSVPEPTSLVLGLVGLVVSGGASLLKHHRRS